MSLDEMTQAYIAGLRSTLEQHGYDGDFIARVCSAIFEGLKPITAQVERLNASRGISLVLPPTLHGLSLPQQRALADLVVQQVRQYTAPLVNEAVQTSALAIAGRVTAEELARAAGVGLPERPTEH